MAHDVSVTGVAKPVPETMTLPPALAFFSGMLEPLIRKQGAQLLEDKSKKG